jgi:hypothetical protein
VNRTGFGIFLVSEASTAAPVCWPDGPADPAVVPLAPAPPAGVAEAGEDADPEAEAPAEADADADADADAEADADADAPAFGVAEAAPDAGPSPALLTAVTVNEYVVPLDRFFTVAPVPVTPATRLPSW